jgi:hypothetical protein
MLTFSPMTLININTLKGDFIYYASARRAGRFRQVENYFSCVISQNSFSANEQALAISLYSVQTSEKTKAKDFNVASALQERNILTHGLETFKGTIGIQTYDFLGSLSVNTTWPLNGSGRLNGARKLNAETYVEEI